MSATPARTWQNEKTTKLLEAMLQGTIPEVKPQLNPPSELGFSFPTLNSLLGITDKEALAMLESLAEQNILERKFFDKFLRCPQCRSLNLRPTYSCPRCGSGNIVHGRVLQHLVCKYMGTEDEFLFRSRLVCPKCKQDLHTLGTDYGSLGLLYKCRDCGDIFNQPYIKWRCLKCSSVTPAEKINEMDVYSYSLNPARKNWLEFELGPKAQLAQFFRRRGYEVSEGAIVTGRSGAQHSFDMLASRDDDIIAYHIAIGIEVSDRPIGLDRVFDFDDKAYDSGLHDKILVAIPGVTPEASRFADRQRTKVLQSDDLQLFLARGVFPPPLPEAEVELKVEGKVEPFQLSSRAALREYLRDRAYQVEENATITGRSGAKHRIDLLATKDDGIMVHRIIIGIEQADRPVDIDKVFDFDDKAYDSGIMNKILVAVPGLTEEATRFAQRQGIKVLAAPNLAPE